MKRISLCLAAAGVFLAAWTPAHSQEQKIQQYRQIAALSGSSRLMMDDESVYWNDKGSLWALRKSDNTVRRVGAGVQSCELVVDGYIYWISLGNIGRVAIATGLAETIVSDLHDSRFLALSPTHIAWVTDGYGKPEGGVVQTIPRTGRREIATVADHQRTTNVGGIVADGSVLYWIEPLRNSRVLRMAVTGGQQTVACTRCASRYLLQDAQYLYSVVENRIIRIRKTDGAVTTIHSATTQPYVGIESIALDPSSIDIYFASFSQKGASTGTIGKVGTSGGKAEPVITGLNAPAQVLVDSTNVYFLDENSPPGGWFIGVAPKRH